MRIAMLSWESVHSIHVGGLGAHVTELASALHRRGHEVHVITRMGVGQSSYDNVGGVHYHRCPVGPQPDFVTYIENMCDAFFGRLKEVEAYLSSPFDFVHGHDWLAGKALARAKNELGRRVLLTMHSTEFGRCGNETHDGLSTRIRTAEWECLYVANRVICVSRALADEVATLYSVPRDKMTVTYNGVDVQKFDVRVDTLAVRRHCRVGVDDPFIFFAGRLARQKGPDLLVEAMPQVLVRFPKAKFVFAGDGDLRVPLEDRVRRDGLADATRFLGYRSGHDLVSLFKTADTVCVPSRNEPFGIVVLEAWSAARPVVATLSGGPGEFVRHQENGLTVSTDSSAIGEGLTTMLENTEDAQRMGRNGRMEAEYRFSWDVTARQTETTYAMVRAG